MKVYSVPGINGLDKTLGVEKNSKRVFESTDFEEVKLDNEDIEKQLDRQKQLDKTRKVKPKKELK